MPFITIRFTEDQANEVGEKLELKNIPEGIMVLTDGCRETVQEALRFINTVQNPISTEEFLVRAEDLLVRAVEGKLIDSAIMW
jgi:hypothetical protein